MPKSSVPTSQLRRTRRYQLVRDLRREANEAVNLGNQAIQDRHNALQPTQDEVNVVIDSDTESPDGERHENTGDDNQRQYRNDVDLAPNLVPNPEQGEASNESLETNSNAEVSDSSARNSADSDENDQSEDECFEEEDNVVPGSDTDNEDAIVAEEDDNEQDRGNYDILGNMGNRPLYTGAPVTVNESVALVFTLMLSHSLTGSCVADLLTVIQLHCLRQGLVKLSLYKLRKYFCFSPGPLNKIFYCSVCFQKLASQQELCPVCHTRKPVSYFIQLPLVPQLKKLFARPCFYNNLLYRFTRRRLNKGWLEDIYDGQLYKEQVQQGFLSNPHNFSMTFFTDGVPVFKSKNYSFWGFFLTINELPYKLRVKRENTLLAGLWFGPKKPDANLFMSSFLADFKKVHAGVSVYAEGIQENIRVRGVVLAGVAHTPAKSTFFNCVHHNGYHGCLACEIRGESVQLPTGTDTHCYRYEQALQKRTVERMREQAAEAFDTNEVVLGVKGPTMLRIFMPDFVRGTALDIMHLIMGVVRKLIKLHFDSPYSGFGFTLRPVMGVVNHMLLAMKPPKFIHRMPRSIEDWCHWKASELKTWFFYYSVPILHEVMRPLYFDHYIKLVTALAYLNASSVSEAMIDKADELLHEFVRDFENLYGLRFCSINIHMLLHLADCVRELGPTWVYSCFPYENINGEILRIIHGKTDIDSQVARMHWQCLDLPNKYLLLREGPVREFCLKKPRQLKIGEKLFDSCYMIGLFTDKDANNPLILQGLRNSNIQFTQLKVYSRLLKHSLLYVAENYNRDLKSCSSYVSYRRGNRTVYGTIYTFVKVLNCLCNFPCDCVGEHFALIRETEKVSCIGIVAHANTYLNNIHKCRMSLNVSAVPITDLSTVCFFMAVNNNSYIAEPINMSEIE